MDSLKKKFSLITPITDDVKGCVTWASPSNIALVKYWGKTQDQTPMNASLSFTLNNSKTTTSLTYSPRLDNGKSVLDFEYYFQGEKNPAFQDKVGKFLSKLVPFFPFLAQLKLSFSSSNNFPHSAGIASSASSMSAIALCICSLERELFPEAFPLPVAQDESFLQKASYVARIGSGSACRSVFPWFTSWGEYSANAQSSNYFAEKVPHIDNYFFKLQDSILIVEGQEKKVSSSAGHELMDQHPFKEGRIAQVNRNMEDLLNALRNKDLKSFMEIVEEEALTLHALMMSSRPSYTLLQPNSLAIIAKVRQFREETGHAICFTIDAGPNIHLVYHESLKSAVLPFIEKELKPLCQQVIHDHVGSGPTMLPSPSSKSGRGAA